MNDKIRITSFKSEYDSAAIPVTIVAANPLKMEEDVESLPIGSCIITKYPLFFSSIILSFPRTTNPYSYRERQLSYPDLYLFMSTFKLLLYDFRPIRTHNRIIRIRHIIVYAIKHIFPGLSFVHLY